MHGTSDTLTEMPAEELTTAATSAAALVSTGVPRAGETITQFVEGPALETRPGPGDAFPTDQWGNTE